MFSDGHKIKLFTIKIAVSKYLAVANVNNIIMYVM